MQYNSHYIMNTYEARLLTGWQAITQPKAVSSFLWHQYVHFSTNKFSGHLIIWYFLTFWSYGICLIVLQIFISPLNKYHGKLQLYYSLGSIGPNKTWSKTEQFMPSLLAIIKGISFLWRILLCRINQQRIAITQFFWQYTVSSSWMTSPNWA